MRKGFGYMERLTALFMAILLLSIPILAQELQIQQASRDAQIQAEADINKTTWLVVGCLFGALGWIAAMLIVPDPPATQLLGKSPDYVAAYTDVYKRKAKSIQEGKALTGCLIGTGLYVAIYVLAFVVLASEDVSNLYY